MVSSCFFSSFASLPHVTVGKPLSNKGNNNNNSCYLLSAYSILGAVSYDCCMHISFNTSL